MLRCFLYGMVRFPRSNSDSCLEVPTWLSAFRSTKWGKQAVNMHTFIWSPFFQASTLPPNVTLYFAFSKEYIFCWGGRRTSRISGFLSRLLTNLLYFSACPPHPPNTLQNANFWVFWGFPSINRVSAFLSIGSGFSFLEIPKSLNNYPPTFQLLTFCCCCVLFCFFPSLHRFMPLKNLFTILFVLFQEEWEYICVFNPSFLPRCSYDVFTGPKLSLKFLWITWSSVNHSM